MIEVKPEGKKSTDEVKSELIDRFSSMVDELFQTVESGANARKIETSLWKRFVKLGGLLLGYLFAARCRRETMKDIKKKP
jgi:hypothetical protein